MVMRSSRQGIRNSLIPGGKHPGSHVPELRVSFHVRRQHTAGIVHSLGNLFEDLPDFSHRQSQVSQSKLLQDLPWPPLLGACQRERWNILGDICHRSHHIVHWRQPDRLPGPLVQHSEIFKWASPFLIMQESTSEAKNCSRAPCQELSRYEILVDRATRS